MRPDLQCEEQIELDDKDIRFLVRRGVIYRQIGLYNEAVEDLEKVLELTQGTSTVGLCWKTVSMMLLVAIFSILGMVSIAYSSSCRLCCLRVKSRTAKMGCQFFGTCRRDASYRDSFCGNIMVSSLLYRLI